MFDVDYDALFKIIVADLVLSGDNAVVIGMAARRLPPQQRRWAIVFGAGGAIGLRVLFTAVVTLLLGIPLLQAIGGVTGWIRAAALAEAWQTPITAHLFPEISVHLLSASRTAGPLEWVSWAEPLLEEPLAVRHGAVTVPDRPGLGIAFDPAAVRRFRLD